MQDDRIFPLTRWVGILVVPILVMAFIILYLMPDRTGDYFAWTIAPTMTSMMMGAGYLAGAYFFLRVAAAKKWHQVSIGFPAVSTFVWFMAVATVLHYDRFNHSHPAFWAWLVLYLVTPVLIPVLWWRNGRSDPRHLDPDDTMLKPTVRWLMAGLGLLTLTNGLLMLLWPTLYIPIWPWQISPLTARIVGGWFALPGVVALGVATDPRWSAARITLQSQMFGIALILIAVARAWAEFDTAKPTTWIFVGGLTTLLLVIAGVYGYETAVLRTKTRKS